MSTLPGFHKIGGATKFSELEMDKTFDESMKQLNHNSTEYDWFFTKLHNDWKNTIEGKTYTSTLDIETHPEQELILNGIKRYQYLKLIHQVGEQNFNSAIGDMVQVNPGQNLWLQMNSCSRTIGTNGILNLSGTEGFYITTSDTKSCIFGLNAQRVNNQKILLEEKQRHILLDESYQHIINGNVVAKYDVQDDAQYTLSLVSVAENISEYTLGKNTVFDVEAIGGETLRYTLEKIQGDVLIREIPQTVTNIGDYNPNQENFILDISDLTIMNFNQDAFTECTGVVFVNKATYDLLLGMGLIEEPEPGQGQQDHPLINNPDCIIRVVV